MDFHNEALNKGYAILGELSTAYCGTLAGGTFIGKISGGKTISFKSAIIETGEDVMTDQIAGCIDETLGGAHPVKRTVINFVIGGGVNAAKNKISAGNVTNNPGVIDATDAKNVLKDIDATDVKNAVKDVDVIDVTDGKYSLLGEMTDADGKAYERFLKEGAQEGLTQPEIIGIYKADKQTALNKKSKRVVAGKSIEGGTGSKFQEVFDFADNYTLSDDTFNNHILNRHGHNSKYGNKSHFSVDFNVKDGIDSTLRGDNLVVGPNTAGREGYIFEQTFINPIGTNSNGKPLYTLKVVIDETGNVITAFPKK